MLRVRLTSLRDATDQMRFGGKPNKVRIHARVLSLSEIESLSVAPAAGEHSPLVAFDPPGPAGDYFLSEEALSDSFLGWFCGLALGLLLRRSIRSSLFLMNACPSVSFSDIPRPPFVLAIMPCGRQTFNTPLPRGT